MADIPSLLTPSDCALLLIDRQTLLNNTAALARTAVVFGLPIIASTSATKVYSGPLMPAIQKVIPDVQAIDRKSMNVWEHEQAREEILSSGR